MFKRADTYGNGLNSYDAIKLLALFTMVIDHLGAFFWPDAEWLRVIGRIAFPLFLFLVGYSGVWKVKVELYLYAGLITLSAVLTHYPIFPLNILVTIIVTRYVMAWLTRKDITPLQLRGILLFALIWFLPMFWYDYSTLALLFAMSGYLQHTRPGEKATLLFLYTTGIIHFTTEAFLFQFHLVSVIEMTVIACILLYIMQHFTLRTYNNPHMQPLQPIVQWISRNTLPLYAAHFMLFMALERVWFPERLLHFRWF